MRISDWSSDVCSSDLRQQGLLRTHRARALLAARSRHACEDEECHLHGDRDDAADQRVAQREYREEFSREPRAGDAHHLRSDESRVGKESVSTWRFRWLLAYSKKKEKEREH